MIDRINKPDVARKHEITRAKEAKENKPYKGGKQQEEREKEQEQPSGEAWKKFHGEKVFIKPMRLKRSVIAACYFVSVELHSGMAILEVNIKLVDNTKIDGAVLLLGSLDDYFKLRKYNPGDEIPDEFWSRGEYVELGIPQRTQTSGLHQMSSIKFGKAREAQKEEKGISKIKNKIKGFLKNL